MTAADDDPELECRVCRGGPDLPSRPLFSPCLCSGSIGLVHQDCLEAWLKHSRKDNCELCKQKYNFDPEYAENVPDVLPIGVLLYSALKFLPYVFRVLMGPFLWLLYAPSCTNLVYKAWFRKDAYSKTFFSKDWHYKNYLEADTLAVMFKDSTTGLVLMGVIIISSVVLVRSALDSVLHTLFILFRIPSLTYTIAPQISFADFLRLDPLEIEERQAAVAVPAAPIRAFGPIRQQNAPPQRVLRRNRFAHPAFGVVRRGVERPVETKTDSDHGENTDDRFADINEQDMEALMKKLGVLPKSTVSHEDNAGGSSVSGPESNVSNSRFPSDSDTSSQPRKEMRLSDYRTSRLLHGKAGEGNDQLHNSLDSVDDGAAKSPHTPREGEDMNSRRIIAGNSMNTTEYLDLDESHDMHSPYGGSKTKERVMFSRQNKSVSPSSSATRTSYSARRKDAVLKMEKHDYMNIDNNSPNDDELDDQQKYEAALAFFSGESPKGVKAPQHSGSSSKINNNELDELKVAGTVDAERVLPKVHTKQVRSGKGAIHFDEWSDAENENENENEHEGDPDEVEGEGEGEGDEVDAIVEELNGLINDHGDAEIEIHNALDEIFGVRPNHPW